MDYICIFFGAVFLIAGIMFASGKGYINSSAFKNMSQKDKEKIKIVPLCRNIGGMIALSGIIFLIKGFWTGFSKRGFMCTMILWLIAAGLDVWYISKSDRYLNK